MRRRLLLYGAVPLLGIGGMVLAYYSGVPALRQIVAPDSGKEFGLVENVQNLLLLAIAGVAVARLRRKKLAWERAGLLVLLLGAVFMLLEETDYGMQYTSGRVVNVHELGYIENVMVHAARFGMFIFFGGFAILFAESRNRVLRYLAPDRMSVLTILLVTAIWEVVVRLPAEGGALDADEIEFAEVGIYYIVLLYAVDLVFRRELASDQRSGRPARRQPDGAA